MLAKALRKIDPPTTPPPWNKGYISSIIRKPLVTSSMRDASRSQPNGFDESRDSEALQNRRAGRQPCAGGWLLIAAGAILLATVFAIARFKQVPFSVFTRDLLEIADLPYYAGALSTVGWILWAFTAAITGFAATLLKRFGDGPFFFSVAAFSSLLLADDAFLLHEVVVPTYLGVSERLVYLAYGMALCLFAVVFYRRLLDSRWDVLLAGCLLGGFSVVVDQLPIDLLPERHLAEDGAKLLAIAAWCGYFTTLAWRHVASRLSGAAD